MITQYHYLNNTHMTSICSPFHVGGSPVVRKSANKITFPKICLPCCPFTISHPSRLYLTLIGLSIDFRALTNFVINLYLIVCVNHDTLHIQTHANKKIASTVTGLNIHLNISLDQVVRYETT